MYVFQYVIKIKIISLNLPFLKVGEANWHGHKENNTKGNRVALLHGLLYVQNPFRVKSKTVGLCYSGDSKLVWMKGILHSHRDAQ